MPEIFSRLSNHHGALSRSHAVGALESVLQRHRSDLRSSLHRSAKPAQNQLSLLSDRAGAAGAVDVPLSRAAAGGAAKNAAKSGARDVQSAVFSASLSRAAEFRQPAARCV